VYTIVVGSPAFERDVGLGQRRAHELLNATLFTELNCCSEIRVHSAYIESFNERLAAMSGSALRFSPNKR